MNHCEEFQALLDLFVDGELAPDEMARVREHLDGCPACRDYVDGALAIRAAFPSVDDTEVPEGFAEGVMERVRADAPKRTVNFRRRWMGMAAALAACCAMVVLLRTGPAGMGGMNGGASVTVNDAAQQMDTTAGAAYDTAADHNEDAIAEESGMDAGEPAEENGTIAYTAGVFPENAPDFEEDDSSAQMLEGESWLRSTSIKEYDEAADAGVEAFADLPSSAETAAVGTDCAPAEVAGGAAEDCEEPETPAPAPAPEPVSAPAAASAKREEADLVLSSSEVGNLLDAFLPAEDRGTERIYRLTREEFAALQEKLPVEYEPESDRETVTVLVTAA